MEYKTLHLPLLKGAGGSGAPVGTIVGYASVFGLKDLQGDIVPRGAFMRSLRGWKAVRQMPAMLWQHLPKSPCGAWSDLHEDAIGLLARGQLDLKSRAGMAAWRAVKSGRVNGLSIGYLVVRSHDDAARKARVLDEIRLEEISLVTLPANPAARISSFKQLLPLRPELATRR